MKAPSFLGLAALANAHSVFTTLFINGKNQGDGTCVRMPLDSETATNPIYPIDGTDMACGRNGSSSVPFICPAKRAATLTFQFRTWPSHRQPGSIDPGHLGPCAVYVKKLNNPLTDKPEGRGWFKIWEDGYNSTTNTWCVDTLVRNDGLLSVRLPAGLPMGYYLVRPEVLALHFARRGDPQFYLGCAQIFLDTNVRGPLRVPKKHRAKIPGYVTPKTPGLSYDIYQDDPEPYPMPGPRVFIPRPIRGGAMNTTNVQQHGVIPEDCEIKNANWCAKPLAKYREEDECWDAVKQCYEQSAECRAKSPAVGAANCETWSAYCQKLNDECEERKFDGPPEFKGEEKFVPLAVPIPEPWNDVFDK